MKSRIIQAEPIEELSAAYMKELRSHNNTRMVYEEINPYAEVYRFREHVYGIYTDNADGGGAPWSYLILGPEKAMLIDTGFGIGNLKGLAETITGGMPLIVVNTHSHRDHAYGNYQFDTVYCHEYAVPYLEQMMNPNVWDFLFDGKGNPIWLEFDPSDIIPYREYQIAGCPDGYCFCLGGDYQVELIFLGGHDAGHAGFLDKKSRILFCGDAFLSMWVMIGGPKPGMPYGEYATVREFSKNLKRLSGRTSEFDSLFPGHFIVDIGNTVVGNMLEACDAVIGNPDCFDYQVMRKGRITKYKSVKGLGALAYTDDRIG